MPINRSTTSNFSTVVDCSVYPDPSETAFIEASTNQSISYKEFSARVARAGNVLRNGGVERNDRIALFFPNELTYLYAFFGAMRIGAVPVPINIQLSQEVINFVVEDCGAKVLIMTERETIESKAIAATAASDGTIDVLFAATTDRAASIDVDAEVRVFDRAMHDAEPLLDPIAVSPTDPAMQPYTSGSTGKPKGVILNHGGIAWNTDAVGNAWSLDTNERGIAATPLYHKNAMPGVKALLDRGGSTVVMDGFEPEPVLEAIDRYDITFITGVPAMFKMLLNESKALDRYNLSSLSFAICGSAPVSPSLHEHFEKTFGAPLLEAYGLTEGGPVVSLSPRWGVTKTGSTGLALPGCETVVVDADTGIPVPHGTVGELLVSNPGVGRYHNRPDENKRSFVQLDGQTFLRTGDLVEKDEDGYHYIVGRVDDMMIVGGENVYPTEVEDLLLSHDVVTDAAVVSAPHSMKGEAPVAFIVADGSTSEDELKEYTIERGPPYAHPRRVFFREELPLTGTEKVDRRVLESLVEELLEEPL